MVCHKRGLLRIAPAVHLSDETRLANPEKSEERYREGTQLEKVRGRFQADFDRVEFLLEKATYLLVLENLTLQRRG